MKNYLRFLSPVMLLIMAVMFGGGKIYAKEVTYSVKSKTSVTASVKLEGVTASFKNTGTSNNDQVTKTKEMTLTIKGFTGKVTAFKLNQAATKSGTGSLIISINGNNVVNKTFAVKELGSSSTDFKVRTYNVETPVVTTGNIVIKLSAKENSLYCNSFTLVYEDADNDKTPTTLSFSKSETSFSYDLNFNDGIAELVNPATLSPNVEGATISYAISESTFADGEISVDNGTVTFYTDKEASATITASYVGNDTYEASTASYTIKVVKPVTVEDGVFDFTGDGTIDYGSGLKPSTNTSYIKTSTWKAGKVTMTTSEGDGVRWWKTSGDNELRAYSNTKIAFSVPDGYVITYIDLGVYNSIKVDCGSLNNTKWNGSSQVVTFTVSDTKKLKNITVKYAETLTTSAGGYATYSADYAVNYSELGLTAYTLTVDETNKTVTAKEFTGVVPAGGAVLVKGDASKAYTLTPATTEGDATFATALQTGATKADGTQYGFTTKFGTPAFAQVQKDQDIPAKKGYIELKGASAAKYSICFGDEATGIQTIEAASAANATMYNLAGQRVDKAYKGIVIVNGKKCLNK